MKFNIIPTLFLFSVLSSQGNDPPKDIIEYGFNYTGDFKDGKRHGIGKYVYPNGDTYEGEFFQNTFHGQGKFTYTNGDVYEGQWENNKFISN